MTFIAWQTTTSFRLPSTAKQQSESPQHGEKARSRFRNNADVVDESSRARDWLDACERQGVLTAGGVQRDRVGSGEAIEDFSNIAIEDGVATDRA